MSTASTLLPSRRVGLTRHGYKGESLHGARLKKELPIVRQPTPEEDINRPPEDTSDEDLGGSDFEDEPAPKRRKGSDSEDSVKMESKLRLPLSEFSNARDTFTTAPSNIQATPFTTSRKRDVNDDEEPFSQSQSRRSKTTYTRKAANIHTNSSNSQETEKPKSSPAKISQDAMGFMKRDMSGSEAKRMDSIVTWPRASLNGLR